MKAQSNMNLILTVSVIAVLLASAVAIYSFPDMTLPDNESTLKQFSSYEELVSFLSTERPTSYSYYSYYNIRTKDAAIPTGAVMESATGGASEYSTTNIQVEGVDEPDFIKNDGKYIYAITGNKLVILDAYPAEDAAIISEIEFEEESISNIFLNSDRLVVFGDTWNDDVWPVYEDTIRETGTGLTDIMPYPWTARTFIKVYDITDRSSPELVNEIYADGNYYDSRMIGDYVYTIVTAPAVLQDDIVPLPRTTPSPQPQEGFPAIYYFDVPDDSYTFTTIMSLNIMNNQDIESEIYLTGNTRDMYVSQDNIYITFMKMYSETEMIDKMLPELMQLVPANVALELSHVMDIDEDYMKWSQMNHIMEEYTDGLSEHEKVTFQAVVAEKMEPIYLDIQRSLERTVIHRISIDDGNIDHEAEGIVNGRVLNQFSMDEYNGNFRIATTTGRLARSADQATSANHIYVLDMGMDLTGSIEDLAPGESIYSARFMGDKGYLVTFRKIDPLFVIDLSDPSNPSVLGKLKIPGYSDYLHPYDENHLIGIGKETMGAEEGDFSWHQGIKISLFDVSDVSNPREVAKIEIGDRGSDSYALRDHKSVLFDRDKNLLVIPILVAELDESDYSGDVPDWMYGEYVWQGAYVFDITTESIDVRGRITHVDDDSLLRSGYYYSSPSSVKRSLYMDDVLYTISSSAIKMNDLDSLDEINSVELPVSEYAEPSYYY